jgi:hypothetical protein
MNVRRCRMMWKRAVVLINGTIPALTVRTVDNRARQAFFCQERRPSARESNPLPPEYKSGLVTT